MTQGIELLSKIIGDQSSQAFRFVRPNWLQGDEAALYEFIRNYLSQYRQLPSLEVLAQNSFETMVTDQPMQYYLDQLTNRYTVTIAHNQAPRLLTAVREYDVETIRDVYTQLGIAFLAASSNVEFTDFQTEARLVLERAEQILRGDIRGITTGYPEIDGLTGGFMPQDLNIIAGRPWTGKSYVLLKSAYEAWITGESILMMSQEMSNLQMASRLLSITSGYNPDQFKFGDVSTWGHYHLNELITGFTDRPPFHFLVGDVRKSVDDVETAIERLNPGAVYVDAGYLLMPGGKKRSPNRRERVTDTIEDLKGCATRTYKSIQTTVQLSREVVKGKKKNEDIEIGLEHAAETDAIGQQASIFWGIKPPKKDPISRSERTIDMGKNRDGEGAIFRINYRPPNFNFLGFVEEVSEDSQDRASERRSASRLRDRGWSA